MSLRTLLVILIVGLVAVFAAINWTAFTTPTTLSLLFATGQAPLGLIMLVLAAAVTFIFFVFALYQQASALADSRRHSRELSRQMELAEQAEVSRFTELRHYLEAELERIGSASEEARGAMQARLDRLDQDLKSTLQESGNTLTAYMGEIEDRIERHLKGRGPDDRD